MPRRRALSPDELTAIETEIANKAPRGMSDDEFDRYFGPAYEQAVAIAENTAAPLRGSSLSRALSGLWNALPSPKAIYQSLPIPESMGGGGVVAGPVNALAGIANAHAEEARKAFDAPTLPEKIGHGIAAVTPIVGPMAANIAERTAATGDVAGAVGGAAGLIAPVAAVGALRSRVQAQQRAGVPALLEREATQQVADRVLAPGNVKFRGRAQEAAKGILDRGMAGSRDALREAADAGMQKSGGEIDAAIQRSGGPQAGVYIDPIVTQLRQALDDISINGVPIKGAEGKYAELQARMQQIEQQAKTRPIGSLPVKGQAPQPVKAMSFEELRKIRDEQYAQADQAKAFERNGDPQLSAQGFAASQTSSAIRQEFGKLAPELAQANADYAFFKTLGDVLDPAQGRPKQTAPTSGITGGKRTVGTVMGSMAGGKVGAFVLGTVLPWIEEYKSRPEWQLADAQSKMRLAAAIRAGNVNRARGLMAKIAAVSPRQSTSPSESQSQTTAPAW